MAITKLVLKRYLHLIGMLVAGGAGAALWLMNLGLPLSSKVTGTLVLAVTLLTSLKDAFSKADEFVDLLPIADGVLLAVIAPAVPVAPPPTPTPSEDDITKRK
jgi:hypothetical protein